jgi:hypothetical protein
MNRDEVTGWWPAPGKPRYGEPRRMSFWSDLLWNIMLKQQKGKKTNQIFSELEDVWEVAEKTLKEFLKQANLLEHFKNGTLDPNVILPIFHARSGMWTPGTRKDIKTSHGGPGSGEDTPPLGGRRIPLKPPLFWKQKSASDTGKWHRAKKQDDDTDESLDEGLGSAWMFYNHHNQDLADSEEKEDPAVAEEIARRRAINPWLGGDPHTIQEGIDEDASLEEASGSAWMFYNHYNPELLKAVQQVLVGEKVEDIIDKMLQEVKITKIVQGSRKVAGIVPAALLAPMQKAKRALRPISKGARDAVKSEWFKK